MKISDFKEKVAPGMTLIADGTKFTVEEVVKYRFEDGNFYIKCYLSDNHVIAEDSEMNVFILVKPLESDIIEPVEKDLEFDDKEFEFLYFAHTIAEEVWGEGRAEKGSGEKFWDYMAKDGSYLSLGISDGTDERLDFYGKTLVPELVELEN